MSQKVVENSDYVPERVKKLQQRIDENKFDIDAWNGLIREAQIQPIHKARKTYEDIIKQFSTSGRYWKIYIEHEMKTRNYDKVEKLFQRCLVKVLNIDLWKCYLNYVRETKSGLSSFREKMTKAYEFAIDKIGYDVMSFPVWADYINFSKSAQVIGSYADNQRITAVRKIYQRGCKTPISNVEQLWREYSAFEQSISQIVAKKMLDDTNRDFLTARRITKELEARTRSLQRNSPSTPPVSSPEATKQVELWKLLINWEKSNPLRVDDVALVTKRVMFAYEQSLLCLGYYPDIWYEAANFLNTMSVTMQEKGDTNSAKRLLEETANLYERAISNMMHDNQLIHFAYADFEESRGKVEKVHGIYKRLLDIPDIDQTLTYIQYMKFARRSEGIGSAREVFKKARKDCRITYEVYVAAAMMEYHCSKDKQIGFRIYDLGLKRFDHVPEYLISHIEYMSHLNEDNNTRVLFERVLTSGNLPPEHSEIIWNKYCEFENNVGDLTSLLKIESRRKETFADEYEGKVTCLLVDRYRFFDLYPCSKHILRSIGYQDVKRKRNPGGVTEVITKSCKDDNKSGYQVPDLTQMLPYKPKVKPYPGHNVPGGEFPIPGPVSLLLKLMPPPRFFKGPFVKIDDLMDTFIDSRFPKEKDWLQMVDEGGIGLTLSVSNNPTTSKVRNHVTIKRPSPKINNGAESDDDVSPPAAKVFVPPPNDVYRSRQQRRVRS